MHKKIKQYICLSLSIIMLFSSSLTVHASNTAILWSDWSITEKVDYIRYHFTSLCAEVLGVVFRGDEIEPYFAKYYEDNLQIENGMTYDEWVLSNVSYDESTNEFSFSDEFMDLMYLAVNKYIEEEKDWCEAYTLDYREIPASNFSTQGLYQSFISYCKQNLDGTDNVFIYFGNISITTDGIPSHCVHMSDVYSNVEYYHDANAGDYISVYITQDWNTFQPKRNLLDSSGGLKDNGSASKSNGYYLICETDYPSFKSNVIVSDGKRLVRVYKSLEDLKNYSAGQRPYYTTSDFRDYDVNGDNSCVLSESEIGDGSTLYGDISNHIVNNYENYNGLSEDALMKIVDMLLKNNNNDNDNDDNDDSGGNGLGGLLGGIGALGDAILSILGKLIEYIGKALSLLTTTVDNIIEFVPGNITKLLTALFPFIPQEWVVAIELSLVLGVILGIVGLFKK